MAGYSDRLRPCGDVRCDSLNYDWRAEYSAVKYRSYRTVRGFPHFFEVVFAHSRSIRSYRSAFYGNSVFFCRESGFHGNSVVGGVSVFKTEVVVFGFQLNIRLYQYLFYPLPEHSCHFVSVHLNERSFHLYLSHGFLLISWFLLCIREVRRTA